MNPQPALALRTALLYCVITGLVFTVLQIAIAVMALPSAERVWPGIMTMMMAQAVLVVGAAACIVGLVRLAMGVDPTTAAQRSASALSPLPWVLIAILAVNAVVWLVRDAGAAIGAVVFALVGAQAWFALRAARRVLKRATSEAR